MGFKEIIKNKFAIKRSNKHINTVPCKIYKDYSLSEILSKINVMHATSDTPKSRINLVYNFGEGTDVTVSFSQRKEKNVIFSKGLSVLEKRRLYTSNEWNLLNQLDMPNVKLATTKQFGPAFILEASENLDRDLSQFIKLVNQWAECNYPLVVGVDVFESGCFGCFDVSALNLLSLVLENSDLRFVFHYRGLCNINFLNIPSCPSTTTECPSGFFEGKSINEKYLNSMIELRSLLEKTDHENGKLYRETLLKVSSTLMEISGPAISEVISKHMNIYDNKLKIFFFKTNTKYRMGYSMEDGGKYVKFNEEQNKFDTNERYVLVTRDTVLMLNGELVNKLSKINISSCTPPNITWYDGVPGCGKTYKIIKQHVPGKDLVLTQTRAGIKEIRKAIINEYGTAYDEILYKDYRTVASYIINQSHDKLYNRVFIDEAVLMHAGYVGFVAKLSGASEVILLGDSKQIPYIERSRLEAKWHRVSDLCGRREYDTISHRCPMDVCYALSSYYPHIATNNKNSISILPTARDSEFHQLQPETLILTFTQEEKRQVGEALKWNRNTKIHTIHEAQGLTSKRVILVRVDYRNKAIYESTPHAIVALTRHTESFRYITNGQNDAVIALIQKVKLINKNELVKWNANRLLTERESTSHLNHDNTIR
jgi:hypothetical protein